LERSQKNSSHSEAAALLGFGFVFAQSQAVVGMLLRSASPKRQNLSLPNGYTFSSNALSSNTAHVPASPGFRQPIFGGSATCQFAGCPGFQSQSFIRRLRRFSQIYQ
jgi:hypothetical protein